MIRSVKLRNWKSHEHSDLHFASGANVLVGPMGAGKTSVVDAICFALFGTFPALKSRKVALSEVVMNRPQPKQNASVEVEFDAPDGKTYVAQRIVNAKTTKSGEDKTDSEAYLRSEGKLIDGPQPIRTNESIQRVLGVDYELFVRAAYAEQNKVDALLSLTPKERKKQFDELLGIDRFETARGNAVTLANKFRAMRQAAQDTLGALRVEELQKQEVELTTQLTQLDKDIHAHEHTLKTAQHSLTEARAHSEKLSALEKAAIAAEQHHAAARGVAESLEKQLASRPKAGAHEVDAAEKAVAHARTHATQLQAAADSLLEKLAALDSQLAGAETQARQRANAENDSKRLTSELDFLLKSHGTLDALEKKVVEEKRELQLLTEHKAELQAELAQCDSALAALAHKTANCPVCERPLDSASHEKTLKTKTDAKNALLMRIKGHDEKHRAVAADVASLDKAAVDARRLTDRVAASQKLLSQLPPALDITKTKTERDKMHAERAASRDEAVKSRKTLDDALTHSQKLKETVSLHARLDTATTDLHKKRDEAEHARKNVDAHALEKAREAVVVTAQAFERASAEQKALTQRLSDKKTQQTDLARSLLQAKNAQERADALGKKSEGLSVFSSALLETQEDLRAQLVGAINDAMALLWHAVYPYRDYSALRVNPTDADYALELQTPSKIWVNADSVSGGERSCAALTMRMALAWVLAPNLHWLFLDEPTHNLDRTAVERLSTSLREEIPKLVGQVFIITHDDALKEGAGGALFKFERDKDRGDVTQVEKVLEASA